MNIEEGTRVPEVSIKECAGSRNNLVPKSTKLSAIYDSKDKLGAFGVGIRTVPICVFCNHAKCTHYVTPTAQLALFLDFPVFSFGLAPEEDLLGPFVMWIIVRV